MKRYSTFAKFQDLSLILRCSLVSSPEHSLWWCYFSAEMQLAYSTAQADWGVNGFKYCYPILIILFNINHSFAQLNDSKYCNVILIRFNRFIQLNGFKYSKWLNNSSWLIDRTQTDTTTPGHPRLQSPTYFVYVCNQP